MTKEEVILCVEEKINSFTGLNLARIQEDRLFDFLSSKAELHNVEVEEYARTLDVHSDEFQELITLVTVNETYFFREQLHFDMLQNFLFPKFAGKKMHIWSCACATGEEPISLLALALNYGIDAQVYASDIDKEAIRVLKKGLYNPYSFRNDGKLYNEILKKYGKETSQGFQFDSEFLSRIKCFTFNLLQEPSIPINVKFDVIFLRNVFIYFDRETRNAVIRKLVPYLNPDGVILLSINEIGSFGKEFEEIGLYKTHYGSLYYFTKGTVEQNKVLDVKKDSSINKRRESILASKRKTEKVVSKEKIEKDDKKAEKENEKLSKAELTKAYEKISSLISSKQFNEALEFSKQFENNHSTKAFSKYFQGFVHLQADEKEEAIKFFETCKMLKHDFWPAYFYNGLALRDVGKYSKANENFEKCIQIMDELGRECEKYDFVLDSFNPNYIYNLCKTLQTGERS